LANAKEVMTILSYLAKYSPVSQSANSAEKLNSGLQEMRNYHDMLAVPGFVFGFQDKF